MHLEFIWLAIQVSHVNTLTHLGEVWMNQIHKCILHNYMLVTWRGGWSGGRGDTEWGLDKL